MKDFDKFMNDKYEEYLDKQLDLLFLGGLDEETISLKPSNDINYQNLFRLSKIELKDNILELDGKNKVINKENNEIVFEQDEDYLYIDIIDNLVIVYDKNNDNYKVININGEIIDCGDIKLMDFPIIHHGIITVKIDGKYNYKNSDGELLLNDGINEVIDNFDNGYIRLFVKDNVYYLLPNGKKTDNYDLLILNYVNMHNYSINKTIFGYNIIDPKYKKISIKFMPVLDMGEFILCYGKKEMYLYNKTNKKYLVLGKLDYNFKYNDHLIFNNNKVLLVYKNKVFDITNYYNSKLKDKDKLPLGNIDILTKEEFSRINYNFNLEEYEKEKSKLIKEHKLELIKKEKEDKEEKLRLDLEKQIEYEKLLIESAKKEESEAIDAISKLKLLKNNHKRLNYDISLISKKVDSHYEFYDNIMDYIKWINLMGFDFTNFKLSNLDLSETNICFDPQTVYNKDLSNGNYCNLNFFGKSFNGVNICGSKLGGYSDIEFGILPSQFEGCIYDDNTYYNGVLLSDYIKKGKSK